MTGKARIISVIIHVLLITAVIATAVFVRSAASSFTKGTGDETEDKLISAMTDDNGLPYLTDMDSYYHVRLVDQYLGHGSLGDGMTEDGRLWDLHSYAPEGRSAEYQPGIVWVTAAAWKLTGSDPAQLPGIEYRISALVASLSALVAYIIGCRAVSLKPSGRSKRQNTASTIASMVSGTAAGLLVACAPQFATRTCYGRFDTDMFVVLMELLLILFMTEALRAPKFWQKGLFAVLFAGSAVLYAQCWTPRYAMLFAGLTAVGGVLFLILMLIMKDTRPKGIKAALTAPSLWAVIAGGILTVGGLVLSVGTPVITSIFTALGFTTSTATGEGVLPNMLASISELKKANLFPRSMGDFFRGYVANETPSVINGIGGGCVMALAVAGLVWLAVKYIRGGSDSGNNADARKHSALYLSVLGVWFVAGLFLSLYGIRFIEHLSIPAGLLAAVFPGLLLIKANRTDNEGKALRKKERKDLIIKNVLVAALVAVTVVPSITGAVNACSAARPTVSTASVASMQFVRKDTQGDSLLASWWDMGYFYEAAGDRACLWDGGSQDSARAIMVSKALVTDDLELSRRIILMLSGSGNSAIDFLMEKMPTKDAFDLLWKALVMDKESACALLVDNGLTAEDAARAEAMIHPAHVREAYLILTYTMTRQIGWYEYYANWDFTGTQEMPSVTMYSYTPDGTPMFNTKAGQEYLDNVRGNETMWRLFFDAEKTECFTPEFEWHDGLEHVRIWKVEA